MTKCECKCGGEAKPGRRFIAGHNRRGKIGWNKGLTKETDKRVKKNSENISKTLKGRTKENYDYLQKFSEDMKGDGNPMKRPEVVANVIGDKNPAKRPEVREKISETLIALWNNPEYRELHSGKNHPKYGKTKETDEGIRRHSELIKGRTKETDKSIKRQAEKLMGRTKENNESVRKGAEKKRGRTKEKDESVRRQSEKMRGRTKENHEGVRRQAEIIRLLWQDPKYIEKMTEARIKGQQIKPNRPERQIETLLNQLLPNEYKINVKGEVMTLGRKIPDFVNVNGQKKVIEFNGDYWHTEEETEKRVKLFKSLGYETLVIWEHELEDMKLVVDKILEFNGC